MKKSILALMLVLSAFFCVYGQNSAPADVILLLDTSSGMSSSNERVNEYITGAFLSEFLRIGDTFHLITYSGRARLDVARRIQERGDVETIIGRMLLQYPIESGNDVRAALSFAEEYASSLPRRPKKIVIVGTGSPDINNLVSASRQRLGSNASVDFVSVTAGQPLANLPSSGRPRPSASPSAQSPAGQTATQGQQAQRPAAQTQTPSAQTPAGPSVQTPGTQRPAAQTPGTQTPAGQTPGGQTSTQGPSAQTPGQTPSTQSPAAQTPAVQSPGAQSPGAQRPSTAPGQTSPQTTTQGSPGTTPPATPQTSQPGQPAATRTQDGVSQTTPGTTPSPETFSGQEGTAFPPDGSEQRTSTGGQTVPGDVPDRPPSRPLISKPSGEWAASVPLIAGIIIGALLLLGLIILLASRRLGSSPNRVMASVASNGQQSQPQPQHHRPAATSAAHPKDDLAPFVNHSKDLASYAAGQNRQRSTPYDDRPKKQEAVKPAVINPTGPLLLNLFVEDQNTAIGKRNIHSLKSGYSLSVGGGKSDDFYIFLVPMPPHIGEIRRNGSQCSFIPRKPKYFPDLGSNELRDCVNKTVRIVSDKNYEIHFRFEMYEDPLIALNRMLMSVKVPG